MVKPVRALTNTPVPVPSEVLSFAVVGLGDVLQHTPLAVTVVPPPEETFPPLVAVFTSMFEASVVVTVGGAMDVVKVCGFPYEVPELFVAYALK